MPERLYTVAPKDCLWNLAERFYQQPTLWPQLFAYNNRPEIIQRTGTAILDPDLILIGQKLVIPERDQLIGKGSEIKRKISEQRQVHQQRDARNTTHIHHLRQSQPVQPGGEEPMARSQAKPLAKPAVVVELGESKIPPVKGKGFSINLSINGKLIIQGTQAVVDGLTVENLSRVKFKAKQETETAAGTLIQDAKLSFDPKARKLTISCGLTSKSNIPNAPEVALVAGVNALGQPTLKGTSTHKLVKGKLPGYAFASEEVTFEVEVTLEDDTQNINVQNLADASSINWSNVLGVTGAVLLVAGAAIFVVGTLAEDVVTLGAGVADDPASFAIAAGMVHSAWRLAATHLPKLSPKIATALGFTLVAPMATAEKPVTAE